MAKRKRLRLPNGFGQITEIKSKRLRKPFRAMVTVGKTDLGKPICKILKPEGYFATYNEAYSALMEYNRNPYELAPSLTVEELYEKWSADYFAKISPSGIRTITSAWSHCEELYKMDVKSLRVRHIKGCVERHAGTTIENRIKSLFNLMLDYAVEYEIVNKNYARDFKVERPEVETGHLSFTPDELETLWRNINVCPYAEVVLIQSYMGWRPQELCRIRLEDVNLENMTMLGGMKTDTGKNRLVPIPTKIKGLVERQYALAKRYRSDTLITCTDGRDPEVFMTYDKYRRRFESVVKALHLNPKHRCHDPRKTFITMAKDRGVDEYAIKYLVGHAISDITEKIYTERDLEWLRGEIEKLS
jgi:integrase